MSWRSWLCAWLPFHSTTSAVMQVYLKSVLESFLHPQPSVRMAALHVVNLILRQGLVHPVQVGSIACQLKQQLYYVRKCIRIGGHSPTQKHACARVCNPVQPMLVTVEDNLNALLKKRCQAKKLNKSHRVSNDRTQWFSGKLANLVLIDCVLVNERSVTDLISSL